MSNHAFLPPSAAHTWSQCAQWALMNQRFPQDENAESVEGTAAHWVGWEILAGRNPELGAKAPNGALVTDEMLEGGDLLAETIESLAMPGPSVITYIEEQLPITFIDKNCFGTPDYWTSGTNQIAIVDYKFGHRFVDEWWNPQGLCYLLGILEYLKIGGNIADRKNILVSFTVVQPRCFYKGSHVRTHTFNLLEADPHFSKLVRMAKESQLPEPTATTNDHCGDCPGRHACSALQLAAYTDAEYSNARTPVELSPAAAALELRLLMRSLDRLEARVEGLKEQTISNIRAGERVPYFRVEQGFGRQTWNIPDAQVIATGKLFGVDLSKPGTMTPTQAKKAGVDEGVIKANTFTPSTALKLVAENPADAPKVFGNPGVSK